LLWVPANALILETVTDASDCFGVRWSMILQRDHRMKSFEDVAGNRMTPSNHMSKKIVEVAKQSKMARAS